MVGDSANRPPELTKYPRSRRTAPVGCRAGGNRGQSRGGMHLNKSELIDAVASSTGESKRAVSDMLEATLTAIQKQVKKGDSVTIPGFGTFSRRARSARTARNPRTGEEIKVKATKVPAFKPGTGFKTLVSGKK